MLCSSNYLPPLLRDLVQPLLSQEVFLNPDVRDLDGVACFSGAIKLANVALSRGMSVKCFCKEMFLPRPSCRGANFPGREEGGSDTTRHDTTRHHTTPSDTTRHDTTR